MAMTKTVKSLVARATMSADDVRAHLTKDHNEALDLAKRMHEAKGAEARLHLFQKLKPALVAHSRAEEKEVYDPLLKAKSKDAHDIANEGYVEHSLLDELLARLHKGSSGTDAWKAEAKVLFEMLQHHVQEEQSDMYADLGDVFTSEQLAAMGKRFELAKATHLKARVPAVTKKAAKKGA